MLTESSEAPGTVLITGANGFVGRRLCALATAAGWSVVACVRQFGSGNPTGHSGESVHLSADVVAVDVADPAALAEVVRARLPTAIIHLASVGVSPAQAHDLRIVAPNLAMSDAVVRAAVLVPGCRVVMAGSMAEYGVHLRPLSEDFATQPGPTLTSYAVAKLAAGLHARALGQRLGVPVVLARLFGVFGPGESAHRLFPTVLGGLRAARPIDLSDGRQRRDFVHVDDVSAVLLDLVRLRVADQVVNVGTGVASEIAAVCRSLADAVSADHALLRFGARARSPGDADLLVAETSRLRAAIGWVPPARLAAARFELGWFG